MGPRQKHQESETYLIDKESPELVSGSCSFSKMSSAYLSGNKKEKGQLRVSSSVYLGGAERLLRGRKPGGNTHAHIGQDWLPWPKVEAYFVCEGEENHLPVYLVALSDDGAIEFGLYAQEKML